jgi:hypothetical protein
MRFFVAAFIFFVVIGKQIIAASVAFGGLLLV